MGRKKKKNRSPMPPKVYYAVFDRAADASGYPVCEIMHEGVCVGQAAHWHHRQLRSQGGGHHVSNGLAICEPCHRWVHNNPSVSYERGWLVKSHDDPGVAPVRRRGALVRLFDHGGIESVPERV